MFSPYRAGTMILNVCTLDHELDIIYIHFVKAADESRYQCLLLCVS
jgi:hypothetical protein